MSRRGCQIALWLLGAVGLGVSLLLLWEYTHDGAGVCGPDGGCAAVRGSRWAEILGVPTPAYGVLFFTALLATTTAGLRAQMLLSVVAVSGAAAALGFIALQWLVVKDFCQLCLVADGAALAATPFALLGRGAGHSLRGRAAGAALAVALALAPLGIARQHEPEQPSYPPPLVVDPLPAPVAAEQRPDVVTIVEFVDFQCPHCRRLHGELSRVLAGEDAVRVVRKNVPLPVHDLAIGAARCAVCARRAGEQLGDKMADALMTADDISLAGGKKLAATLGLNADTFASCLDSEEVVEAIAADVQAAQVSGVGGLPTYFIGNERFEGYRPASVLRESIARARAARK